MNLDDIQLPSKHIAFKFVEHVTAHGLFVDQHESVIEIVSQGRHYESANSPRQVDVIKCSHDVNGIKPGDRVLVAPLRWSFAIHDDARKFHVTTIDDVLAVVEV